MKNRAMESQRPHTLAKGQTWRTGAADIQILGIANRFIHYTVKSRLGRRRTSAQISGIEPMENYLKLTDAHLVQDLANVCASRQEPAVPVFHIESSSRRSPAERLEPVLR